MKTPGAANTRLYLHVFDWPRDGRITVSGLLNGVRQAYCVSDQIRQRPAARPPGLAQQLPVPMPEEGMRRLLTLREAESLVVEAPGGPPDSIDTVVALRSQWETRRRARAADHRVRPDLRGPVGCRRDGRHGARRAPLHNRRQRPVDRVAAGQGPAETHEHDDNPRTLVSQGSGPGSRDDRDVHESRSTPRRAARPDDPRPPVRCVRGGFQVAASFRQSDAGAVGHNRRLRSHAAHPRSAVRVPVPRGTCERHRTASTGSSSAPTTGAGCGLGIASSSTTTGCTARARKAGSSRWPRDSTRSPSRCSSRGAASCSRWPTRAPAWRGSRFRRARCSGQLDPSTSAGPDTPPGAGSAACRHSR